MTYVLQLAKGEFDFDSSLIRSLHFMTTSHDMTKWPGRYRLGPVYVQEEETGDIVHEGAPSEGFTKLMKSFAASALDGSDPLIAGTPELRAHSSVQGRQWPDGSHSTEPGAGPRERSGSRIHGDRGVSRSPHAGIL